jgi:opacity protein-like surface antigen
MKKILLSLAAVAALAAAAAPAAAQEGRWAGRGGYDYGRHQTYGGAPYRLTTPYVDGLDWKIRNAAQEGRISWGEARELRREYLQVKSIAWRVQTGEARRWEIERLDRVVTRIEQAVNTPRYAYGRRDRHDRGYGWDR